MMTMLTKLSLAAALLAAAQLSAAVIVPDSTTAPFEDWSRGYFGSTYAEWDVFTSAFGGTNSPDVGEVESASATLQQSAFGAVLTGGGNIYSPAGAPQFVVSLPGLDQGAANSTRVVAQLRSLGTSLNVDSVMLTPDGGVAAAPSYATVELTGSGFSAAEEHVLAWDVSGNASSYTLNFAGAGAHFSLDRLTIDAYTHVGAFTAFPTAVPSPASLWLIVVGAGAALPRRGRIA